MKKVLCATAVIVMSVTAIVTSNSNDRLDSLIESNIEALAQDETSSGKWFNKMERVPYEVKITSNVSVGMTIDGHTITLGDIEAGYYCKYISCCTSTLLPLKCDYSEQNKDC